jgi:hypothetical protein
MRETGVERTVLIMSSQYTPNFQVWCPHSKVYRLETSQWASWRGWRTARDTPAARLLEAGDSSLSSVLWRPVNVRILRLVQYPFLKSVYHRHIYTLQAALSPLSFSMFSYVSQVPGL